MELAEARQITGLVEDAGLSLSSPASVEGKYSTLLKQENRRVIRRANLNCMHLKTIRFV